MFVRKDSRVITDAVPGTDELFNAGIIKAVSVGDSIVHYVPAVNYFDNLSVIVQKHPEKLHKIKATSF